MMLYEMRYTMRKEHDFLGELELADELYYGVQTLRGIENFFITGKQIDLDFVKAMAMVKKSLCFSEYEYWSFR